MKSVCSMYVTSHRLSGYSALSERYVHAQKQSEKGVFKLPSMSFDNIHYCNTGDLTRAVSLMIFIHR